MLRAFVDESYCDEWFYMVAAVADDETCRSMTAALNDLVADLAFGFDDIEPGAELHGYEIFQGAGPWGGVDLSTRLSVAGRVLQVVAEHDVAFIIRGIDRVAQAKKYNDAYEPYPLVLTHIFQEIDKHAGVIGERAHVTCDEIHQHDRHRAMLDRQRMTGTPTYNPSKLQRIVDRLEFISSDQSRMIQAADIVAYLKHRAVSRPNARRPERRARQRLWNIIDSQVAHDYCWEP
ncbi:hypothetical protein ASD11_01470 [Aeromicrobium sp. Root495]|uniref:DUF3800 domain-containing protein n=1 Tax=Aeromicrobium sp. Root495 TaxID=1736550 RepID=UPI0006F30EA4|nr:DUF3800 domain-containing protein [Aeromicrobium sp. Root495]KQY58364.1 hypothetical protein ASD11_01470 [Aeromicrobium sp. Root495]